jgi:hypothetical protein
MDPLGLVVLDDQLFLARVVKNGMEQGLFTRDRADEIIRVSVAMANKYVLQKEVDFRSTEELAKVQETILKLVGVGLEMKSRGEVDTGVRLLMEESPVDLFRLAYTRVARLRHKWKLLLQDHRIEILVSPDEYEYLDELTCQRLAEMSVFTEAEIDAIRSAVLDDALFSSVAVVEYYESELQRYQFRLRLKEILPFRLLNKSPSVRAISLAEVDSIRDALVNTLIISGCVESEDPVAVAMGDVRKFLADIDPNDTSQVFPEKVETVVVDLIHELGEGLEESDAAMLTRDIIAMARNFMETIRSEWDTVNSPLEHVFFKRWCRLGILSDIPDPIRRILSSGGPVDEFDFDILLNELLTLPEKDALQLAVQLPWKNLTPDQVIRLFHELRPYQPAFAPNVSLAGFKAAELVDLLEVTDSPALQKLEPALKAAMAEAQFTLEDLELVASLPHKDAPALLRMANPPADYEPAQIIAEFRDGSDLVRRIFFHTGWGSEWFPELVHEAALTSPLFVKGFLKSLPPSEVGPFLEAAAGGVRPKTITARGREPRLRFQLKELNDLFTSLPVTKRKAALRYFLADS